MYNIPFFKTDDLQLWTNGTWLNLKSRRADIRGFSVDSRDMRADFAFVALKGERDGHDFAANAVENGATAVIAERELDVPVPVLVVKDSLRALQTIAKFHRLRFENPVVAITGSCGKTSTKQMLAKMLAWRNPLATEKNYNNEIGVPLTLTRIDMRQNQVAIVEAGVGAPGQMRELAEIIEPDIAIITNVGLAHLGRFAEVSAVAKEKAVLPAHVSENGWCVMHQNLLSWKAFDELACKKAVIASADAPEVRADLVFRYSLREEDDGFIGVDMCVEKGGEYYFEIPHMSAGMVENALLAIAASLMLGTSEQQLAAKAAAIGPLPMRGSVVKTEKASFYVDCYNASPTSMRDALGNFAYVAKGAPKLYVLGTMGELGIAAHRHHKETGANLPPAPSDSAVLVGANAEIYKAGMLESGWNEARITICETAEQAKPILETFENGFVFVKGSRVCELEKALPGAVLSALEAPEQPEPEPDDDGGAEFEPPAKDSAESAENSDDGAEDDFDEEFDGDFDGEGEDGDETGFGENPEDEREF